MKEGRVTVAWTPVPLLCKRLNVPVSAKSSIPLTSIPPPPGDLGEELFEKHIGAYISVPADMKMEFPQAAPEAENLSKRACWAMQQHYLSMTRRLTRYYH